MSLRGPIGLADLLDAVVVLGADDDRRIEAVGACLGLRVDVEHLRALTTRAAPGANDADVLGGELRRPSPEEASPDRPARPASANDRPRSHDVLPMGELKRERTAPAELHASADPALADGVFDGADLIGPGETEGVFRPERVPLFRPQWERAVLSAAVATRSADGRLDVERLVELVTRQERIERLPRLPSATLRRGLQLLVDRGPALMPFAEDQRHIVRALTNVAGTDRTEVLTFLGCPTRGADSSARLRFEAWRPPAPGTPIVLCSDLGIARRRGGRLGAPVEEWIHWARLARNANCPVLALTPYEELRPRALERWMKMLTWDRRTSVATVREEVGRWLEAER